MPFY
jgi:hypothetical protein